jgi:hypothetical protein
MWIKTPSPPLPPYNPLVNKEEEEEEEEEKANLLEICSYSRLIKIDVAYAMVGCGLGFFRSSGPLKVTGGWFCIHRFIQLSSSSSLSSYYSNSSWPSFSWRIPPRSLESIQKEYTHAVETP